MKLSALPWLSGVLFVISCFMPALTVQKTGGAPPAAADAWGGLQALAIGWMGLFTGMLPWFANPLWLAASVFLLTNRWRVAALVLCIVALALAATTFGLIGQDFPADEGGVTMQSITRLETGAYVWFACLVCQMLTAAYLFFADKTAAAAAIPPPLPPKF